MNFSFEKKVNAQRVQDETDPIDKNEKEIRFALNKLSPDNTFRKLKDIPVLGLGSKK